MTAIDIVIRTGAGIGVYMREAGVGTCAVVAMGSVAMGSVAMESVSMGSVAMGSVAEK